MRYTHTQVRMIVVSALAVVLCVSLTAAVFFGINWIRCRGQAEELKALLSAAREEQRLLEQEINQLENKAEQDKSRIDELNKQLEESKKKVEQLEDTIGKMSTSTNTKIDSKPVYFNAPQIEEGAKLVALTFDDGPSKKTTPQLLDALKARNIPATFFVVGQNASWNKAIIRRMHDEGHVVANHTLEHKFLTQISATEAARQIDECSKIIEGIIGEKPTLMRTPGGKVNDSIKAMLADRGMPVIYWSVDTRDWESRNVNAILKKTFDNGKNSVRDGSIVLMHDIYQTTVDAAILIMDRLLEEGYTFVTVPELLAARKSVVLTGQQYSSAYPD